MPVKRGTGGTGKRPDTGRGRRPSAEDVLGVLDDWVRNHQALTGQIKREVQLREGRPRDNRTDPSGQP
jgi:hypothetical protein